MCAAHGISLASVQRESSAICSNARPHSRRGCARPYVWRPNYSRSRGLREHPAGQAGRTGQMLVGVRPGDTHVLGAHCAARGRPRRRQSYCKGPRVLAMRTPSPLVTLARGGGLRIYVLLSARHRATAHSPEFKLKENRSKAHGPPGERRRQRAHTEHTHINVYAQLRNGNIPGTRTQGLCSEAHSTYRTERGGRERAPLCSQQRLRGSIPAATRRLHPRGHRL